MWIDPKTNWTSKDVPLPGDFNRIEGNVRELDGNVKELKNTTIARARKENYRVEPTGFPFKIPFDRIDFDIGRYYDSTNHQYVPPAGYYRVSASVHAYLQRSESTAIFSFALFHDNATYNGVSTQLVAFGALATVSQIVTLSDIIYVNGTQALSLKVSCAPWAVDLESCLATFEKI
jgi:hypothetical protein